MTSAPSLLAGLAVVVHSKLQPLASAAFRSLIPPHVVADDKRFWNRSNPLLLIQSLRSCVCDGRKQCVGILPGVESSVLYDNWDIGLDDACIVGPPRNWLRIL
jgi:hypothetical protein